MAAILGLDDAVIEAACAEAAQGEVVQPVNYNAPGQLVIAGSAAAVARAIEACKARGAKRAVPLPVSVPSHSALMKPAAEALRERLEAIDDQGAGAARALLRCGHLHRCRLDPRRPVPAVVQSGALVRYRGGDDGRGRRRLFECGPGKMLTGLARRAPGGRDLDLQAIESPETLEAALASARGEAAS